MEDLFFTNDRCTLCFRIYGATSLEKTVVYFHGLPGSRIEAILMHEAALRLGISVIAIDRPGFGRSTYFSRNCALSFAEILENFVQHLKIKKCSLLAISGGGPYALACAYKLPDTVEKVALVNSPAPFTSYSTTKGMIYLNRIILEMTRKSRSLGFIYIQCLILFIRAFPRTWVNFIKASSKPDQSTLDNKEVFSVLMNSFSECVKGDSRGPLDEVGILLKDWDFLSEIKQHVHLYCGDADPIVPFCSSVSLKETLSNSSITKIAGEGHLLAINHIDQILLYLTG